MRIGGDGGHAAPPQEHYNFKDPTEVTYLNKINKRVILKMKNKR